MKILSSDPLITKKLQQIVDESRKMTSEEIAMMSNYPFNFSEEDHQVFRQIMLPGNGKISWYANKILSRVFLFIWKFSRT